MGRLPNRPSPATTRDTLDEIAARRRRADDPTLEQLSDQPWEVLEYLRRNPARLPKDTAADGQAALILLAELRWQIVEHEYTHLTRLDQLPLNVRPSSSTVGSWIGSSLHRQSVRDRRDRDGALLHRGPGHTEHDARAVRAADRERATHTALENSWLTEHAVRLHALRDRLLTYAHPVADETIQEWLDDVGSDHREQACGRLALATLSLTAESLQPADTPELNAVLHDIAEFRTAARNHTAKPT